MHLSDFQQLVDTAFPPAAAMPGDRIGMQIESRRSTATRILVCYEVSDAIVGEAVALGADVVLTFHPLIFQPLSTISRHDRVGRLVADLIASDVALISVHTILDAMPNGTNALFAEALGLDVVDVLEPSPVGAGYGMGVIARPAAPLTMQDLIARIQSVTGKPLRWSPNPGTTIDSIGIVCGSGMSFFGAARSRGVDVFVTADVKYHDFHAAAGHLGLVDPGHFEMEQHVSEAMATILRQHLPDDITVVTATTTASPLRYAGVGALLP